MKIHTLTALTILSVLTTFTPNNALAYDGWIDVHFHIVSDKDDINGINEAAQRTLEVMEQSGMSKILVLPPPRPHPNYDIETIKHLQSKFSGKMYVIGGGGTLNPMIQENPDPASITDDLKKKFITQAETIAAAGAVAYGEITAHQVSLNPKHGYESVPADHPLLLALADVAAKHNIPIDLHFDPIPEDVDKPDELFSPRNPDSFKENITGLNRLLAHNRKAKIIWAHAGSDPVGYFTPDLAREMLEKHDNLYFSIRTTYKRNNPMRHPRFGINDDWIDVLKDFPDRFVMGTDSFVVAADYDGPRGVKMFEQRTWIQREGANEVLDYLDGDLARKIGYDNAVRLYNLK